MRLNTNLVAINANNQLLRNQKKTADKLERVSSALRINSAADDAAGLAISEKIRAQIRGLSQAQRNVQDGISLIQTAEAGLSSIIAPPLQRMRELAIQAANGTLTDGDRRMIQDEVDQIKEAIDGIANGTEFNTQKLIDGSLLPLSSILSPATYSSVRGAANLAGGLTISAGANDTLNFDVDGASISITLAAGAYNSAGLLTEINNKLTSSGAGVTASYSGSSLALTHNSSGAAHIITNFSGNAIPSLFLNNTLGTIIGGSVSGAPMLNPGVIINAGVNDALTFDIDGTIYNINIPPGGYIVNSGSNPSNSPLLVALNSALEAAGAPAQAGYIYYVGSPPYNGTGLRLIVGSSVNGVNTVSSGPHTIGSFAGNAKTTLFDEVVSGWVGSDSSGTFGVNVSWTQTQVTGIADLSAGLNIVSGINDTLQFNADGVPQIITLASGSYDSGSLLTEINNQLSSSGAGITASYVGSNLSFVHNMAGIGHTIDGFSGNAFQPLFLAGTSGADAVISTQGRDMVLQVGANSNQTMVINIHDMRVSALGLSTISMLTTANAQNAISLIDNAISYASTDRSQLGAFQNALEHIASNLANSEENMASAESRIRDADIAKEMIELTKSNIMVQASQAMQSQANQVPEMVLQLINSMK